MLCDAKTCSHACNAYVQIRARVVAGDEARQPNIVFLDAHCIVYKGWLEAIGKQLKKVVVREESEKIIASRVVTD